MELYGKQNRGALSNKTVAGASTFGLRKRFSFCKIHLHRADCNNNNI